MKTAPGRSVAALPVLRQKIHFALLAETLIRSGNFDVVAIAWPVELEKLYREALAAWPHYHCMEVSWPGKKEPVMVPVDPADAFTAALRTAESMEIPAHFAGGAWPKDAGDWMPDLDDEFARLLGLDRFLDLWKKNRPQASKRILPGERKFAERVRAWHETGKRVLVLCEIQRWQAVEKALQETVPAEAESGPRRIDMFRVRPASVKWISGEIPQLISRYVISRKSDRAEAFDRWAAIEATIREARKRIPGPVDADDWERFELTLWKSCDIHCRHSPSLWELVQCARATLGEDWALAFWRTAGVYRLEAEGPSPFPPMSFDPQWPGPSPMPGWARSSRGLPNPDRPLVRQVTRDRYGRMPWTRHDLAEEGHSFQEYLFAIADWMRPTKANRPRKSLRIGVVLSSRQESFPWKRLNRGRNRRDGDLAFTALHPLAETAFKGTTLRFGSFAWSNLAERMADPFRDGANGPEASRLFRSLAEIPSPAPLFWTSPFPPEEEDLAFAHERDVEVVWRPLGDLPAMLRESVERLHTLGYERGRRILELA